MAGGTPGFGVGCGGFVGPAAAAGGGPDFAFAVRVGPLLDEAVVPSMGPPRVPGGDSWIPITEDDREIRTAMVPGERSAYLPRLRSGAGDAVPRKVRTSPRDSM